MMMVIMVMITMTTIDEYDHDNNNDSDNLTTAMMITMPRMKRRRRRMTKLLFEIYVMDVHTRHICRCCHRREIKREKQVQGRRLNLKTAAVSIFVIP